MTTGTWHCSADLLRRYDAGAAEPAAAASVEAHLLACATCRATLAGLVDTAVTEKLWERVRDAVQTPPLPRSVRWLQRFGLSREDGVLLAASRSMRGPWTFAVVVVLVAAAWAGFPDDPRRKACYLLLAPLVPVLGVVAAFGTADSDRDLVTATPYPKARLALLRTVAVVATTVPFVVGMSALVPGIGWLAVAWLGPALGLTLTALALLTWLSPQVAAATVLVGWTAVVAAACARAEAVTVVTAPAQAGYLVLAAVTALILAIRVQSAHLPGRNA